MTDINPTPSWPNVRQLETNEFATGGANGNMNEQAKSLAARSELLKRYAALPYESKTGGYALSERVQLTNGDIVKSTIPNNIINPNVDMTGWVNANGNLSSVSEMLSIRNPKNSMVVFVASYYVGGVYGGDEFIYSKTSALIADSGIVFDCPDGGKWIRLHKGTVSFDDYGAKRDGSDQSSAIENAITNVYCRSIEQSDGEFIVNRTLKKMLPRTDVKMHPDAWIKYQNSAGGVIAFLPADDCSLQVNINGNQYPLSGNIKDDWIGANSLGVSSLGVGGGYGFDGNYEVKNVKIKNSKFINISSPIRADGSQNWLVQGNYFENIKQSCCLIGATNQSPVINNKFAHNTSINIGDTACATFQVIGNPNSKISGVQMTNNFAMNTQMRTMGCSFDFEGVKNVGDCTDGLISGNIVIQESQLPTMDTVGRGGVITGANVSDTLISNNIVVGKGLGYGIVASFSHNISILGNMVRDFPGGGISILGTTGSIVDGNTLTNCGSLNANKAAIAVMTQAASVLTKEFTVRNNTIKYDDFYVRTGTSSAICVESAGGVLASNLKSSIDGNEIYDPNGTGIIIRSTNATPISGIALNNNKVMSAYAAQSFVIMNAKDITLDGFYSRGCQRFRISGCLGDIRLKNLDIESTVNGVGVLTSTGVEISDSRLVSPNGTYLEDDNQFSDTSKQNKLSRISGTRCTENKGKCLSSATGVTIPHGLVLAPKFIELTWLVSGITSYYVSEINTTNFKVNFVGAASADLMWKAEV